jgi:hypothetical protein
MLCCATSWLSCAEAQTGRRRLAGCCPVSVDLVRDLAADPASPGLSRVIAMY